MKALFVVPTLCYSQNRFLGIPASPNAPTIADLHAMLDWDETVGVEETGYELLLEPEHRDLELLAFLEKALRKSAVISGHGAGLASDRAVNAYPAAAGVGEQPRAGRACGGTAAGRARPRRRHPRGSQLLRRRVRSPRPSPPTGCSHARSCSVPMSSPPRRCSRSGSRTSASASRSRTGSTPMQAIQLSSIQPAEHLRVRPRGGAARCGPPRRRRLRRRPRPLLDPTGHGERRDRRPGRRAALGATATRVPVVAVRDDERVAAHLSRRRLPDPPAPAGATAEVRVIVVRDGLLESEEAIETLSVVDGAVAAGTRSAVSTRSR